MGEKTMTPLLMVAKELEEQCKSMTCDEYEQSIRGLLKHLHDRAYEAIQSKDVDDGRALKLSKEYCTMAQLVSTFGTALIAFDDLEQDAVPLADLDPDDDGSGGRMN